MAIDPSSLTIDAKKLMRLSVSDRNQMIRTSGYNESILTALTPYQIAMLFPQYYREMVGGGGGGGGGGFDLSSLLSGMTPTEGGGGGGTATPQSSAPVPSLTPGAGVTKSPPTGITYGWVKRFEDLNKDSQVKTPIQRLERPEGKSGPGSLATLATQRAKFAEELKDPWLKQRLFNIMANEQGAHPEGTLAIIESAMNRAHLQGTTLRKQLRWTSENGYYAGREGKVVADSRNPIYEQNLQSALGGSNRANYATDNSSGKWGEGRIGFYGKTQKFQYPIPDQENKINGEQFTVPGTDGNFPRSRWQNWVQQVQESEKQIAGQAPPVPEEVLQRQTLSQAKMQAGPAAPPQPPPLAMDPKDLNDLNLKRPGHMKGNVTFEGDPNFTAQFGSGGARGSAGSVPYGRYEIMPGLHQHSKYKSFENNSFYVKDMFDPQVGRNRSGILFHQASDWQNMYTHGCLGIRPDQWPAFKAKMMEFQQNSGGGPVYADITPDGVRISSSRSPGINYQTTNEITRNRPDLPPGADPGLAAANMSRLPSGLPDGLIKEFSTLNSVEQEKIISQLNSMGSEGLKTITDFYNQDVKTRVEVKSEKIIEAIQNAPPGEVPQSLVSPVTGTIAGGGASVYGAARKGGSRPHSGVDWQAADGSPVLSMTGGKVLHVGNDPNGYDHYVNVLGDDGVIRRYAGHGPISVKTGERVQQGQQLGVIARGHLHYEEIPKTLNGKDNAVYQEFLKNGNSNTSYQRGTRDPLVSNGVAAKTKVTAGQPFGMPVAPPSIVPQIEAPTAPTGPPIADSQQIQPGGQASLGPTGPTPMTSTTGVNMMPPAEGPTGTATAIPVPPPVNVNSSSFQFLKNTKSFSEDELKFLQRGSQDQIDKFASSIQNDSGYKMGSWWYGSADKIPPDKIRQGWMDSPNRELDPLKNFIKMPQEQKVQTLSQPIPQQTSTPPPAPSTAATGAETLPAQQTAPFDSGGGGGGLGSSLGGLLGNIPVAGPLLQNILPKFIPGFAEGGQMPVKEDNLSVFTKPKAGEPTKHVADVQSGENVNLGDGKMKVTAKSRNDTINPEPSKEVAPSTPPQQHQEDRNKGRIEVTQAQQAAKNMVGLDNLDFRNEHTTPSSFRAHDKPRFGTTFNV